MNFSALRYEELSLNTFPNLQTEVYDGWILRFCEGAGWEDNCVFPLYLSTRAYEDKIAYCEHRFSEHLLPFAFKMTANVSSALDQQLAEKGYEMVEKTKLLECSLHSEGQESVQMGNTAVAITITRQPEEDWLEAFLKLRGICGNRDEQAERILIKAVRSPICCAAVVRDGSILGCGLGILKGDTIGLYDIRTAGPVSGSGLETAICRAIMREGYENGAQKAYIQIPSSSRVWLNLYEFLGFHEVYQFWYRRKPVFS